MTTGLEIGSVFAGHRIDALAGRGGMGLVYRATNLRLKRVVAIKVIADELASDPGFRERFASETEIAAQIEHPHVIPLYDAGESADGQLFITMRYIDGTNMAELIARRGRLEPPLAARLVSQIASALDAAHAQGLVHRDVKPANVLISGKEGEYHAYLTDFGLTKRISSRTAFTTKGMMVGTVDYMAPEQAEGRKVDLRADVYSLGCVLYEALAGAVPYPGGNDVAKLVAKVREPPPVVSQAAPGVSAEFDATVARALARDPGERFRSAGELGRAALAAAAHRPESVITRDVGVGSMLADCQIEEIAGEGGMAVVYRATQLKLGRTVALKVMARELAADPAFRERFEREWRVAASIDHPNVIPIYWAGEADGLLYIVMRFVEGSNLKEILLTQGRLDPARAVEVVEQLASALDAAHERNLVHRDVKPGNVLIEESTGHVYLTDFGVAKAIGEADITGPREVLGTARYIAPERSRGLGSDDARGDIYSLGCLLWDLLGGTDRVDLARVDAVPEALAAVVSKAVELEPSARFSSAGALAEAGRQALGDGAPRQARSAGARPTGSPASAQAPFPARREPFAPEALSSGLAEQALALCEAVLEWLDADDPARADLEAVRDDVRAPLRIAVTGPSGSGKSTLVNALLGRRVAPTGRGTLAAVPLWFSDGTPERVEVELSDGGHVECGLLPDGSLPEDLGAEPEQISSIRVRLPVEALRTHTLIDTPSAESVPAGAPDGVPDAARAFLGAADAFVFALAADPTLDARQILAAFRRELAAARVSAVNAVAVLTLADRLGSGDDGRPAAASEATRLAEALASLVSTVVPCVGLLAQTANAGAITERDAARIRELAGLGLSEREQLLGSEASFLSDEAPLPVEDRSRLLELLGIYGLRCALELADAGQLSAVGLVRRLRELSGIEDLGREIDGFHQRADALKAGRALAALEQLSYSSPQLAFLRDRVETVRFAPEMHLLDLIKAFDRCVAGEVEIPPVMLSDLERLITARTPALRLGLEEDASPEELQAAARDRVRFWRIYENGSQASPAAQRAARVVERSYEMLAIQGGARAVSTPGA